MKSTNPRVPVHSENEQEKAQDDRAKSVRAPADLLAALKNNSAARVGYDALSPSHKREYIEWITEARRGESRKQRVASAVEWMAEGRIRNWKYVR